MRRLFLVSVTAAAFALAPLGARAESSGLPVAPVEQFGWAVTAEGAFVLASELDIGSYSLERNGLTLATEDTVDLEDFEVESTMVLGKLTYGLWGGEGDLLGRWFNAADVSVLLGVADMEIEDGEQGASDWDFAGDFDLAWGVAFRTRVYHWQEQDLSVCFSFQYLHTESDEVKVAVDPGIGAVDLDDFINTIEGVTDTTSDTTKETDSYRFALYVSKALKSRFWTVTPYAGARLSLEDTAIEGSAESLTAGSVWEMAYEMENEGMVGAFGGVEFRPGFPGLEQLSFGVEASFLDETSVTASATWRF